MIKSYFFNVEKAFLDVGHSVMNMTDSILMVGNIHADRKIIDKQ